MPACISPRRPWGSRSMRRSKNLILSGGADAAIEVFEIGAATEGDVLTIVDVFAVGQDVGSRAAAEKRTLLEESNAPARFSQRDAGRQTRQPAADHDHVFQGYSLPRGGRSAPLR